MSAPASSIGSLVRTWRQRRALSQLALALEAETSQRHLSFIESGRAAPSREMVLRLAEHLRVPLRERNAMLLAAGFAPVFRERAANDPDLALANRAVEAILKGHEPYPALAFDRHWNLQLANAAVQPLLAGVDDTLLRPPVNVLRLALHPQGLAPRIANFREWRNHLLTRLSREIDNVADAALIDLWEELQAYSIPAGAGPAGPVEPTTVAVPLRLVTASGTLSFISTTTVFGTALDIALAELAIETFFPADDRTAKQLHHDHRG